MTGSDTGPAGLDPADTGPADPGPAETGLADILVTCLNTDPADTLVHTVTDSADSDTCTADTDLVHFDSADTGPSDPAQTVAAPTDIGPTATPADPVVTDLADIVIGQDTGPADNQPLARR